MIHNTSQKRKQIPIAFPENEKKALLLKTPHISNAGLGGIEMELT